MSKGINSTVDEGQTPVVTHSLRGEVFDASEDGTGRGTPLVPVLPFDTTQITSPGNYSNPNPGDPCHPLARGAHAPAVAYGFNGDQSEKTHSMGERAEQAPTLRGGGPAHVAYAFQPRIARNGRGDMGEVVNALNAQSGETGKGDAAPCVAFNWNAQAAQLPSAGGRDAAVNDGLTCSQQAAVATAMQVRRLTPTECERLQGFPDGHTGIPYRNKPAVDGPRYKALGNSMAVPVMRHIGIKIMEAVWS